MRDMKLNEEIVTKMGGALDRLAVLGESKIFTTEQAAEKRGNEQFLQNTLLEHAPELLGAWITVRNQYVPLVRGFATLLMNANQLLQPPKTDAAVEPSK